MLALPVLELAYESNLIDASATPTWTLNSSYAHNGYMQFSGLNAYVDWPIVFSPQGSIWLPIPVLATGPDFGQVTLYIANAQPDPATGVFLGPSDIPAGNWKTQTGWTFDAYSAVLTPFGGSSQIMQVFRVMGTAGTIGTGFSAGFYGPEWNGGPGGYGVRLKVTGKNGASAGFKCQVSSFVFLRLGDDGLA